MSAKATKGKFAPGRRVRVRVPASTSNLGPGFDCLGLALALHNVFVLEPDDNVSVTLKLKGCDDGDGALVATGRRNLVWRSASELFRLAGAKPKGLKIRIEISAPPARGLGSSATAIIAGVAGANALLGSPLSDEEVFELIVKLEGHPDNVAASYYGGLTIATMQKRLPMVIRHSARRDIRLVAAIPSYPLSTEKARAALPEEVPFSDAVHNLTRVAFVVRALTNGSIGDLAWAMDDRLHEPYRSAFLRNGRAIRRSALAAGAAGVAVSGAGPALVAFCPEAVARKVSDAMREQMKGGRVEVLSVDGKGTRVFAKG